MGVMNVSSLVPSLSELDPSRHGRNDEGSIPRLARELDRYRSEGCLLCLKPIVVPSELMHTTIKAVSNQNRLTSNARNVIGWTLAKWIG